MTTRIRFLALGLAILIIFSVFIWKMDDIMVQAQREKEEKCTFRKCWLRTKVAGMR